MRYERTVSATYENEGLTNRSVHVSRSWSKDEVRASGSHMRPGTDPNRTPDPGSEVAQNRVVEIKGGGALPGDETFIVEEVRGTQIRLRGCGSEWFPRSSFAVWVGFGRSA